MTFDDLDHSTKQNISSKLRKYNIKYGYKNVLINAIDGKKRTWKKRDIGKEHIKMLIEAIEQDDYIVKGRDNINMDFWVIKREVLTKLKKIYKELDK